MSEATKIITPTPGRAVWYYPSQDEINAKQFACNARSHYEICHKWRHA